MIDDRHPTLSEPMRDTLDELPAAPQNTPTTRREFIAKASALGVALPAVGVAIAGCSAPGQDGADSARAGSAARQPSAQGVEGVSNPSSRADSVHRGPHPTTTTATSSANVA